MQLQGLLSALRRHPTKRRTRWFPCPLAMALRSDGEDTRSRAVAAIKARFFPGGRQDGGVPTPAAAASRRPSAECLDYGSETSPVMLLAPKQGHLASPFRSPVVAMWSPLTAVIVGFRSQAIDSMVGVRGFEPPAPASRKQCSTRLSYTPPTAREL